RDLVSNSACIRDVKNPADISQIPDRWGSSPSPWPTCRRRAEYGLAFYRARGLVERAWCLAALGRADEAIRLLTTGLAEWEELGLAFGPAALTRLGDACRMAGQLRSALGHLAEARRIAHETDTRWFLAEAFRLTGEVLLAIGDPAAAESSY